MPERQREITLDQPGFERLTLVRILSFVAHQVKILNLEGRQNFQMELVIFIHCRHPKENRITTMNGEILIGSQIPIYGITVVIESSVPHKILMQSLGCLLIIRMLLLIRRNN